MKKKPSQILAAPLALAAVRAAGYDVMRDSLVDTMVQVAYTVWEG